MSITLQSPRIFPFLKERNPFGREGFTLIEVIVVIILSSIVGSLLVTYMGTGFTKSSEPLAALNDNHELVRTIETMNSDYRLKIEQGTFNPDSFKANLSSYAVGNVQIAGAYVSFSGGVEVAHDGSKRFLKVTVGKNNKTIITLLSN